MKQGAIKEETVGRQEVNTEDHEDHRNHHQQPAEQEEKRQFRRPANAEKWCEIYRIIGHNMEECKSFLDRKKMPEKSMVQEP
jgi:hypothetical protein